MEIATIAILFVVGIIGAIICRGMASNAGRRVWLWTVLGFLVPIPAVIVLVFMGRTDKQALAEAERRFRSR